MTFECSHIPSGDAYSCGQLIKIQFVSFAWFDRILCVKETAVKITDMSFEQCIWALAVTIYIKYSMNATIILFEIHFRWLKENLITHTRHIRRDRSDVQRCIRAKTMAMKQYHRMCMMHKQALPLRENGLIDFHTLTTYASYCSSRYAACSWLQNPTVYTFDTHTFLYSHCVRWRGAVVPGSVIMLECTNNAPCVLAGCPHCLF